MNSHYLYAWVDIGCLLVPLIASFHPAIPFYKKWKFFFPVAFAVALVFIVWDTIFTKWGVWSFNPAYVIGLWYLKLPVEEWCFFIFIPYSCTFTYYCCNKFMKPQQYDTRYTVATIALASILFGIGLLNHGKLYTFTTFILLALLLFVLVLYKVRFLKVFYLAYALNLIPFFISNGILTGAFTDQPVVLYNDHQNLGIRVGSIPIEDFFYGMLLQLANVAGLNFLDRKDHE